VCVGCRKKTNQDDQTTRPQYINVEHLHPTAKADDVQGTPPPEYCPRATNAHQRARVKSRFDPTAEAANQHSTESGEVPESPANRTLDKSGYADLGLGYDAASSLPHGYTNTAPGNDTAETSMNRSLRRSPRRGNQLPDTSPVGYVNRSFIDDTGVSDRPARGRSRSSDADETARGDPRSAVPMHSKVEPPSKRANRSFNDSAYPGIPELEVTDGSEGRMKPSKDNDRQPDDTRYPSHLPRDTKYNAPESPSGTRPGDRSFEIVAPGLDAEDLVPGKPFEAQKDDGSYKPKSDGFNSAFDRLYPQNKPDARPDVTGGVGPRQGPPGGKVDSRLNRSFDPSSYLPDSGSLAAGTRQGSAPDVRQGANTTVYFNTAAQAIDV